MTEESSKGLSLAVADPEEGDIEFEDMQDSSLKLRGQIMKCLQRFEDAVSAVPDRPFLNENGEEVHPIPEVVEEDRRDIRLSFYSELNSLFSVLSDSDNYVAASTYEESVYRLLLDRMRRSFGYYQALSRAEAEVHRRNSDIGDASALSLEIKSILSTLGKLDTVDLTRSLCKELSISEGDTSQIISCIIDKEFAKK